MSAIELEDIQGLILSGYGDRPVARYALFEIVDAALARRWLGRLVPRLQFGEYRRTRRHEAPLLRELCANIAFTHSGFAALGLDETAQRGFSLSFQEGMNETNRARRLGDDGPSAPENWAWGRPGDVLHGLLAVFGGKDDAKPGDEEALTAFLDRELVAAHGVRVVKILETTPSNRLLRKEHFGFRDGISNPHLSALAAPDRDSVPTGEFVLGHPNGYGRLPLSPEVPAERDPTSALAPSSESPERRDFGRNGSYLVFRQLRQFVPAFWKYLHAAKDGVPDAPPGREGAEWLGARFVGRWPNGTPLTVFPDAPGPERRDDANRFLYHSHGDAFGARCPVGSHIRRTNPRDTALPVPHDPELSGSPTDPKVSQERVRLSNLHRILRRGRTYGRPLDPGYDPEVLRNAEERDDDERGLHFLCFNANMSRQFEFVQSNWALNPAFAGLSSDPDPLLCARRTFPFPASDFTIQGLPPRRVHDVPRVVETRGGAYFFMPSRRALVYLSGL